MEIKNHVFVYSRTLVRVRVRERERERGIYSFLLLQEYRLHPDLASKFTTVKDEVRKISPFINDEFEINKIAELNLFVDLLRNPTSQPDRIFTLVSTANHTNANGKREVCRRQKLEMIAN